MRWTILCALICTLTVAALGAHDASALVAPAPKSSAEPDAVLDITPPIPPPRKMEEVMAPEGSYTNRRWIGLAAKGGECPEVGEWQAESLVDLSRLPSPKGDDRPLLRRLGLDRFCVYTPKFSIGVPEFHPPANLTAVMDRLALSASAETDTQPLEERVTPILAEHFLGQTGSSALPLKSTASPSVRLTFVDSQPTSDEIPVTAPALPGSLHGYTLGHLARRLVCAPSGVCVATVASRRALSFVDFDPRQPLPPMVFGSGQSGHAGLISELAQAIVDEVLHWRQDTGQRHLILNLSLGWDGEILHDLDQRRATDLEPSVQAVYAALRFAAKRGVLVIAAAGNRRGGPEASGWPILPAAWETRRPWPWPFVLGPKLVYAVGGVDWQGLPLPNYRHGGRPRRVAYGDHGVAEVDGQRPTAIYTGSSVSAAVVSSIAAVVWHLRPELSPGEVMKLINRSGDRLESRADVYPWRDLWLLDRLLPHPRMRRASLCAAVRRACGPNAKRCNALEPQVLAACPAWDRKAPDLKALFPAPSKLTRWTPRDATSAHCDPRARFLIADGARPQVFCPTDELVSAASRRWVLPQPEDPPCPGCTLIPGPPHGRYTLKIEVGKTWEAQPDTRPSIMEATLHINCPDSDRRPMAYPIPFPPTGSQTVTGLGDGSSLIGCRAQIDFVVQKEGASMSIQNPVIVDP